MSELKYKVGDKVRIKSIDWYNENKDEFGIVECGNQIFVYPMTKLCGKTVTITCVNTKDCYYVISGDDGYNSWTDEMIECKVEEEPKPKFKVGDKITNGKDKLLILNIISDKYIVEDNLGECGTVYFNTQDYWKLMEEENNDCKKCGLIRNSTRCLFMDNCPNNKQRKFNVGDIVYSKTWQRNVIIHEFLPDRFYKVGDLFSTNWFKEHEDNLCKEVIRPTTEYILPDGYQFKDENNNIINATKIVLEKKKKEYPKTFVDCCAILYPKDNFQIVSQKVKGHKGDLLFYFQKILICRDVYWKLYGEEIGLKKPWEPDWTNQELLKHCIANVGGQIKTSERYIVNTILAFPTEEMRDAFKENFGPDIEICKELL